MKNRFLVFVLSIGLSICSRNVFAQGQGNTWYFGTKAGLSFNPLIPVVLTDGALDTFEGCASISTPQGQLMFYTDGVTIWNRNHDTLVNGSGLMGGQSTTQTALIIPKPGSNHLYYMFTASEAQIPSNWSLRYSEVDMNLDGGLGAVNTNKNILIFTPIGEKITAVIHANNTDIWVISHDKFTNKYLTYLVTANGVNTTPIVFAGGTTDDAISFPNLHSANFGYLKASPDGTRIAAAFSPKHRIDVLNFDRATGQLTFRFTLALANAYGLEFSPNSNLLYASGYTINTIMQYNLALNSASAVVSTSKIITPRTHLGAWSLQLGPDEKIYVSRLPSGYLDCIQHPNNIGAACDFAEEAVYLGGKQASAGLPNFFPYFLRPSGILDNGSCPNDTTFFTLAGGLAADSAKWNFGDLPSGPLNTSDKTAPFHIYQQAGTYLVTTRIFRGSVVDTLQKPVTILPIPYVNLGPDTTFCEGTYIELSADVGHEFTYTWNGGPPTHPFITIVNQASYFVTVSNSCGAYSDTIRTFKVAAPVPFSLGSDLIFCEGSTLQLYVSQPNTITTWQNSVVSPFFSPSTTGNYIATVSNRCGNVSDTIAVTFNPLPTVSLGSDTSFCSGDSVKIRATGNAGPYQWSNGNIADSITVNSSGTYIVNASNSCGQTSDTLIATKIFPPLPINLAANDTICENEELVLNASQAGASYLWQNGSTEPQFTVIQEGRHWVRVSNLCGVSSDTIFIKINPLPLVSAGPDTSFCQGNPIQLIADGTADSFLWSNGGIGDSVTVINGGTFFVTASNSCGVASDTIAVSELFPPLPINLAANDTICENEELVLNASQAGASYLWQNGSTEPQFTVIQEGRHWVRVSNLCGVSSDTIFIKINPLPLVSAGPDTSFCQGNPIQLIADGIADSFLWSNGGIGDSVTIANGGTFFVTVSNFCGVASDTIAVSELIPPLPVDLGANDTICPGDTTVLNAAQSNVSYLWHNGSTNPEFTVGQTGKYFVRVSNLCGVSSDTVFIRLSPFPTVSLGPNIHSCDGNPVVLHASGIADSYMWHDGSTSPTFSASVSGLFYVTVSNTCGTALDSIRTFLGKKTSDTIEFLECEPFSLNGITYSSSGTYLQTLVNGSGCDSLLTIRAQILTLKGQIYQTDTTLFYAGSPSGIQWLDCNSGQEIPRANQIIFKPKTSGSYRAIITSGKCVDTSDCQFISVPDKPVSQPTLCNDLVISPNPTVGVISFTLEKPLYSIRIFSVSGALLLEKSGNQKQVDLYFKEFANAMYILEIDGCRYKILKL